MRLPPDPFNDLFFLGIGAFTALFTTVFGERLYLGL